MTESTHISEPVEQLTQQSRRRMSTIIVVAVVTVLAVVSLIGVTFSLFQQQRYDLCIDQNRRHDHSLQYIVSLERQRLAHATPSERRLIIVQISEYRILFQDLAPHQDCSRITKLL